MKMSYLISGRTTFPTDWWYKLGSTCHKKPFTWSSRWRRFISEFQLLSGISVHVLVIDFVTPSGHEGSRPDVRFCKLFQVWNWYLVKVIWILFFSSRVPKSIRMKYYLSFKYSNTLRFWSILNFRNYFDLEISRIYYVLSGSAIRWVRWQDRWWQEQAIRPWCPDWRALKLNFIYGASENW